MKNLMDPDSRFMDFCQKLTQCVLTNLLWMLCCLPVVTVGAATTALYANMQAMKQGESCGGADFFLAFRQNFVTATVIWLGILLAGIALVADAAILANLTFPGKFFVLAAVMFLLFALVFFSGMIFPMLSQFPCTIRECVVNGILLSLAHGPKLLLVTLTNLSPVLFFLFFPRVFLAIGFVWILFAWAGIALLNLNTLNKIFAPLRQRRQDGETP